MWGWDGSRAGRIGFGWIWNPVWRFLEIPTCVWAERYVRRRRNSLCGTDPASGQASNVAQDLSQMHQAKKKKKGETPTNTQHTVKMAGGHGEKKKNGKSKPNGNNRNRRIVHNSQASPLGSSNFRLMRDPLSIGDQTFWDLLNFNVVFATWEYNILNGSLLLQIYLLLNLLLRDYYYKLQQPMHFVNLAKWVSSGSRLWGSLSCKYMKPFYLRIL